MSDNILNAAIENTERGRFGNEAFGPQAQGRELDILTRSIERKRAGVENTVRHIMENVPSDTLLRSAGVHFSKGDGLGVLMEGNGTFSQPLTRYALGQAAAKVGFPSAYAADVQAERGEVGRSVVAQALTTLYADEPSTKKVLVRSVNGKVHGVLSDAFRRLDCRPAADAFIGEIQKHGAVLYEGNVTDTRVALKAILPRVFSLGEPGKWNDAVALGICLRNSDFGAARFSLAVYVERVRCLNGMIGEQIFAQTHIGGRLDEADFFSEKTHKLDSDTVVSATQDYVKALLSPVGIAGTLAVLNAAASKALDLTEEIGSVLKKSLTKEELKGVIGALQSVNEDEMPLGPPTAYRMANALSFLAASADDGDRALELQRLAGQYLKVETLKIAA